MTKLFGREGDLQRIERLLALARAGQGSVLLLMGEPGIGKSSIGRAAAALASGAGMRVCAGRCWEAGGAPAYWPWLQIFRALGSTPFEGLVKHDGGDSRERRFQLFDAATRTLASAALQQPILIFLDDLHAADLPSLLLLLFLSREIGSARLSVLGTAREVEARLVPEVAAAFAKIGREGQVLSLSRLGPAALAQWVSEAAPGLHSPDELYRFTEGNPLFVTEMLRVGAQGQRQVASAGVQAMLDEHLHKLSDAGRTLLEAAAVLGRSFGGRELAALAGAEPDALEEQLQRAQGLGILETTDAERRPVVAPERERFAFTHVLLRDRLYEALSPLRRSELHWRAGLMLERHAADPSSVANHLLAGAAAGGRERAAASALVAAVHALGALGFEAAAELAERGLTLLEGTASALACQLETAWAESLIRAGSLEAGREHAARAADRAQRLGCAKEQAQAALTYAYEASPVPAVDPLMVRLLEEALAAHGAGDSVVAARLGARLHAALMPARSEAEVEPVRRLGEDALAMARRLGDDETLLYVLEWARSGLAYLVPSEQRFEFTRDIVLLAERLKQSVTLLKLAPSYAVSLLERGQRAGADAALEHLAQLHAAREDRQQAWRLPLLRAGFAFFDGDFVEAQRLGDEALAAAEQVNAAAVYTHWAHQRIALCIARRAPASLREDSTRLLSILRPSAWGGGARAWVLGSLGRRDEALRVLSDATAAPQGFPSVIVAAEACLLLQDRAAAERLRPLLEQRALGSQIYWGMTGCHMFGPTSRVLGELARLEGKPELARRHYQAAIDFCQGIGARPLLEASVAALERSNAELAGAGRGSRPPAPWAAGAGERPLPQRSTSVSLTREADVWVVAGGTGAAFRLKHSKGLAYLSELLGHAGRELHVLALVGMDHVAGDAGPVLDQRAKTEYRQRLESLGEVLAEAEGFGDTGRAARAREELELLAAQFAGAVGLGGRDRRAASDIERARVNVQRRLKDAIEHISACDAELGRYLAATVKTGTYCSFTPL